MPCEKISAISYPVPKPNGFCGRQAEKCWENNLINPFNDSYAKSNTPWIRVIKSFFLLTFLSREHSATNALPSEAILR